MNKFGTKLGLSVKRYDIEVRIKNSIHRSYFQNANKFPGKSCFNMIR